MFQIYQRNSSIMKFPLEFCLVCMDTLRVAGLKLVFPPFQSYETSLASSPPNKKHFDRNLGLAQNCPCPVFVVKSGKVDCIDFLCLHIFLFQHNGASKYGRLSLIYCDNKSARQKDIDKSHYRLPILQNNIFSVRGGG